MNLYDEDISSEMGIFWYKKAFRLIQDDGYSSRMMAATNRGRKIRFWNEHKAHLVNYCERLIWSRSRSDLLEQMAWDQLFLGIESARGLATKREEDSERITFQMSAVLFFENAQIIVEVMGSAICFWDISGSSMSLGGHSWLITSMKFLLDGQLWVSSRYQAWEYQYFDGSTSVNFWRFLIDSLGWILGWLGGWAGGHGMLVFFLWWRSLFEWWVAGEQWLWLMVWRDLLFRDSTPWRW